MLRLTVHQNYLALTCYIKRQALRRSFNPITVVDIELDDKATGSLEDID
jgi:hypothetical protein